MHASVVLSLDVLEYSVLFKELADVYFEQGMYTEALRVYLDLATHDEVSHLHSLAGAVSYVLKSLCRQARYISSCRLGLVIAICPISMRPLKYTPWVGTIA
jgi:hypothetical protein